MEVRGSKGKQGEVSGSKGKQGEERYFIEAKPLHVIVSMTVYAEIRKQSNTPTPPHSHTPTLLALGDPAYEAGGEAGERAAREFATRGVKLTRLPNTRKEVEAIGRLYGKQARVRVGKDANETAAKQESGGAKALHFACHGVLDNREPLESALALSPSGVTGDKGQGTGNGNGKDSSHPSSLIPYPSSEEDGMLRAYEIFESVRLNADLVVMSACETGLGGEMKNEGIVGMTRAFQYAGAKSVMVSLWKIADESTSQLMVEFYRQRRAGKSKDEALRQAQLTLLRSKTTAHPFYWAPFVLVGDWR